MEVSTPGRSVTEPSTPIRDLSPARLSSGSHTDPNRRSQGVRVPLPPHDIPRLSFSLAQEEARRAERRSRRSGRHQVNANEPTSRSRSRSRRNSLTLDPRLSGDFAQRVKRRRRSSLVEVDRSTKRIFNPGYVEPVTVDYLKFFCKVLIAEKNKLAEHQHPIIDSPPNRSRSRSSFLIHYSDQNPEIDEFNNSLPLPSDTHPLLSPVIRSDPDNVYEHDTPYDNHDLKPAPPSKPKSFSYLERILASQGQKKQEAPAYTFGPQSFKTPASKAPKSPVDQTSPFIIDDKGIESTHELPLPDMPVEQETTPQPISNAPVTATPPYLSEDPNGQDELPGETEIGKTDLADGIEEANFEIPNDLDTQQEHDNLTESPQVPSFGNTLAKDMLSPPTALLVHTPSIDGTPERTFQDVLGFSPSIIQEEYTLMDAVNVPDIIEPDSDDENPHEPPSRNLPSPLPAGESSSERSPTTLSHRTRIPHALLSLPDQEVSTVSSFPIAMIRKMVKSSQTSAFENQVNLVPAARRKVRFRPEIYQEIAAKSSEFILAMMEDLEAYASHRSASPNYQITIKDVLLYLHRIRFIKNNSDEIDTVARLAHSVLPTETLISLDNSIAGAVEVSSGLKSSAESDDLYVDDFYGSESLDDNIAEL